MLLLNLAGCLVNVPLHAERTREFQCADLNERFDEGQVTIDEVVEQDCEVVNSSVQSFIDCDGDGWGAPETGQPIRPAAEPPDCGDHDGDWVAQGSDCDDTDENSGARQGAACAHQLGTSHERFLAAPVEMMVIYDNGITAWTAASSCAAWGGNLVNDEFELSIVDPVVEADVWLDVPLEFTESWCEEPDVDGWLRSLISQNPDHRDAARQQLRPVYTSQGCISLPDGWSSAGMICRRTYIPPGGNP